MDRTTIETSRSLLERAIDKHPEIDVFHKIICQLAACKGHSREDDDLLRRAGKAITILRDQCVAKLDHEVGQRVQVDVRNDGCWYRGRVTNRGVEERHEECAHLLAYKIKIDNGYDEFPTKSSRRQAVPWHAQELVIQRFANGDAVGVWQDEKWQRGRVVAQKDSGRQRQYTIDIEGAVNDYEDNSDVESESDIETDEFDETTGTVESEERIASTETQQRCRIELRSKCEEELLSRISSRTRTISSASTTIAKEENNGAQAAQKVDEKVGAQAVQKVDEKVGAQAAQKVAEKVDQAAQKVAEKVDDAAADEKVDDAAQKASKTRRKKKKEKPNSEETVKANEKALPEKKPEGMPHARRRRR